ncbi:MAG: anti-sigma regulatory factor [Thermodesulfobacteriota bacterium]|nr:anti-sigma regulatory factor [Thermodesulfobacteriota bacterium]
MSKSETMEIKKSDDIVNARQMVRRVAVEMGFSLVDQTKLVTATSELARNTYEHGGGGEMTLQTVNQGTRRGIKLVFTDNGPGISDIEQALKDGYTTAGGFGLGLSGSRRLVNDFDIVSKPGKGTTITITRWK